TIVNDQSNVVIIQDNIVEALLTYSQAVKDKSQKKAINDVYQNHSKNMKTIQHNIDSIKEIITLNDRVIRFTTVLLIIICVFVLLQGFVLYFMLIRKTHRISGPIYVMSMYIRQIIDGKIPEHIRKLRKNDELQEFYDLFGQMVKSLKKSNGS
ncbi:MAG: hypothetical protein KBA61_12695, partial [Spirochaetes bacterium]|nr:hypothetical protein [Spirochaetota bacterium]